MLSAIFRKFGGFEFWFRCEFIYKVHLKLPIFSPISLANLETLIKNNYSSALQLMHSIRNNNKYHFYQNTNNLFKAVAHISMKKLNFLETLKYPYRRNKLFLYLLLCCHTGCQE